MESNQVINANCWVAYFDILGFKNRVCDFNKQFGYGHLDIFVKNDYHDILNEAKNRVKQHKELLDKVEHTWFSDTFLFYIPIDQEGHSFAVIISLAQQFLIGCIWKRHSLSGAISAGELYANVHENIFVGSGLINAHEYTEKLNWLGLVISPNVIPEMQKYGLSSPDRFKYIEYDVPIKIKAKNDKNETVIKESIERLLVFKMHKYHQIENSIRQMYQEAVNKKAETNVKKKYENTIKFMEDNK